MADRVFDTIGTHRGRFFPFLGLELVPGCRHQALCPASARTDEFVDRP
ncbi:hypothetical protein QPK13_03355 [Photorhabdus tasmaniensis]